MYFPIFYFASQGLPSLSLVLLQVRGSQKVTIPRVRLSSNQTLVLALSDMQHGKASINGKIECIGCQYQSSSASANSATADTVFALFVNDVSNFSIEQSQVEAPLRQVGLVLA